MDNNTHCQVIPLLLCLNFEFNFKQFISIPIQASEPGSSPFLVTHFYYLGWPDHGVPEYATSLLGYLRRVCKSHPVSGAPLLVHCSAGVGRTGTFIVLDAMLQRIQEERVVNVCQFVRELRERRCLMVQTMVS